jgi:hypothetical protein
MLKSPPFRSASVPLVMWAPISDTLASSSGSTPRITVPEISPPTFTSASPSMYGAVPATSGFWLANAATSRQSGRPSVLPEIVACEAMPRMRVRSSLSKPFITDSTTISVATPSPMPSIEANEMNEMKWLRRLARV